MRAAEGGVGGLEPTHFGLLLGGFFWTLIMMKGRDRGLFPFPIPLVAAKPDESAGLSRGVAQRLHARHQVDVWVRDIVIALNSMFLGDESGGNFAGDGRPTLSQKICLEQLRMSVLDAGKPPDGISGREALSELQAKAGYTAEPVHLAPMDVDSVSLPSLGSKAASMAMIFEEEAEKFVHRLMTKVSAEEKVLQRKDEAGLRAPYVDPLLKNCPRRYGQFCRMLHERGLVEYGLDFKEKVGAFTVWKKNGKQRLVIDARLANMHFEVPEKVKLATGSTFSRIEVDEGPEVEVGGVDIADAFYHIELIPQLRSYFSLPGCKAEDVGVTRINGESVKPSMIIYPQLKVVPMGWSHALWICQVAHQFIVDRNPVVNPRLRCVDREPVPDLQDYIHTQYVDNFVAISQTPGKARLLAEKIGVDLQQHGLPTHPVEASVGFETLGWLFTSGHPKVSITSARLWRLRLATLELLKVKRCNGKLVERLVGHYTFAGLLQRGVLSVFQATYVFIRKHYDGEVELWPEVSRELRWAAALLCLVKRDLAAKWSNRVHASDASMWGRGVVATERNLDDIRTLAKVNDRWRFSVDEEATFLKNDLVKDYAGLDVETLQPDDDGSSRVTKGASEFQEVPLGFIGEDWKKVDSSKWDRTEPIPILEGRCVVWLLQHLSRSQKNLGKKHLLLTDSMSVVLALSKGRSSTRSMNRICRQVAAVELMTGMQLSLRWIPSELNPADFPSRAREVQEFSLDKAFSKFEESYASPSSRAHSSSWRRNAVQFHRVWRNQEEACSRPRVEGGPTSRQDGDPALRESREKGEVVRQVPWSRHKGQEELLGKEGGFNSPREELRESMDGLQKLGSVRTFANPVLRRSRLGPDKQDQPDVLRGMGSGRCYHVGGCDKVLQGGHHQGHDSDEDHRGHERVPEVGTPPREAPVPMANVVCDCGFPMAVTQCSGTVASDNLGNMLPAGRSPEVEEEALGSPLCYVQALDHHSQRWSGPSGSGARQEEGEWQKGLDQGQDGVQGGRVRRGNHCGPALHERIWRDTGQLCEKEAGPRVDLRLRCPQGDGSFQRCAEGEQLSRERHLLHLPASSRKCINRCVARAEDADRGAKERTMECSQVSASLQQRRKSVPSVRQPVDLAKVQCRDGREVDVKDFRCWASQKVNYEGLGLELFSGSGQFSKAMRRRCRSILCIEVDFTHGPQFDLSKKKVQDQIIQLLLGGKVKYVWMGTPCNSWSRARRWDGRGPGPLRDDHQFLMGYHDLPPHDLEKIRLGNRLMRFSAKVYRVCLRLSIPVAIENPRTSRLWLASPIKHLVSHRGCHVDFHDYCQDGKQWRKRTQVLFSHVDLRSSCRKCTGTRGWCSKSGERHCQLQGSSNGRFLTLIAQPYPTNWCNRLSTAFQWAILHKDSEGLWLRFQGL